MGISERVTRLYGSPWQAGYQMGQQLGEQLERNIARYVAGRPAPGEFIDAARLRNGAMGWLRRLPLRFQGELEGLADGASLPLRRVAEWTYVEACVQPACSGFLLRQAGGCWVARNNDSFVPDLWGYATVREIEARIPAISFGMQGDVFTPTGVNRERLWLHHQFVPVRDRPNPHRPHYPSYVFLSEALETCRSLSDLETFLAEWGRDDGMLLFAVDGKTGEAAVYECSCSGCLRRDLSERWLAVTNHAQAFHALKTPTPEAGSSARLARLEARLGAWPVGSEAPRLPQDLFSILADPAIERRESRHFTTVCATVACPATGEVWHTFGGYPAASQGDWQRLPWPW